MWIVLLPVSLAAEDPAPPPDRGITLLPAPVTRVWLGAGLSGAWGAVDALGGGAEVRAGASMGRDPQRSPGLEARVREVLHGPDIRQVGGIGLVVRYPAGIGPYGGIGFAHHHDAPIALTLDHPVGVLAGTDPDLTHRTGFSLEAGWDFPTFAPGMTTLERFALYTELSAVVLPDGHAPVFYTFLSIGVRGAVGPIR